MGKYIKKSKLAGDVSVSDISNPITSSFRTRAAKNLVLQRLRSDTTSLSEDDSDYLQLRSRRLVKLPTDTKKQLVESRTRKPRGKSVHADKIEPTLVIETKEGCSIETGDSDKREMKPCHLTRDAEAIESVPLSREIEDFFAYAEQKQQKFFIEKYNFDIASENPLPGRYEWVKVEP